MEMHNDVFNYGCCHKYYGWSDLAWSEAEQLSQWAKLQDFTKHWHYGSKFTNYRNYHLRINDGECMIISSYSTADSCVSSLRQKLTREFNELWIVKFIWSDTKPDFQFSARIWTIRISLYGLICTCWYAKLHIITDGYRVRTFFMNAAYFTRLLSTSVSTVGIDGKIYYGLRTAGLRNNKSLTVIVLALQFMLLTSLVDDMILLLGRKPHGNGRTWYFSHHRPVRSTQFNFTVNLHQKLISLC